LVVPKNIAFSAGFPIASILKKPENGGCLHAPI
jgi:hypothetical protein